MDLIPLVLLIVYGGLLTFGLWALLSVVRAIQSIAASLREIAEELRRRE